MYAEQAIKYLVPSKVTVRRATEVVNTLIAVVKLSLFAVPVRTRGEPAPLVLVPPVAVKYITYCPPVLGFEKLIAVMFASSVPSKIPVDALSKSAVSVPDAKVAVVRVSGSVSCSVNETGGIKVIKLVVKSAIFVSATGESPENI